MTFVDLHQDGAQVALRGADILGVDETFSKPEIISPRKNFIENGGRDPADHRPTDFNADLRSRIVDLLSIVPIEGDELIRQSDQPTASVQTVLIELELAGRLIRHDRQLVSLIF